MHSRTEMMDLVLVDGRARGIIVRDLVSGRIRPVLGDAVVLATGGYSNVYDLSTNAKGCNATAIWRAHRKGAGFANPCFTQIHPTCIPVSGEHQSKLTLMSESLRNDGRIWVPRNPGDARPPNEIPEEDRSYYLEDRYPRFGNLVPRDVASRNAKSICDEGLGVGPTGRGVYLDLRDAIEKLGIDAIESRYGNLFDIYDRITGEDSRRVPMRIYPAPHYTMGGLWVDYNLMTNIPGLFAIGEANFSDHGANRLGASSLMQCLADGYFILPLTIGDYLSRLPSEAVDVDHAAFRDATREVGRRIEDLLSIDGDCTVDALHRELGSLMWDHCGISRTREGLTEALRLIPELRERFWQRLRLPPGSDFNQMLEHAGRVADFMELAELMCLDALTREESCGCHFREEHQTPEGEALRDADNFDHVAVWEHQESGRPRLHREPLEFEFLPPTSRDYKR
jgi:succinate dehydrogenase / fumarate reductase flavoprotein subunit